MKVLVTGGSKSQALQFVRHCLSVAHDIHPISCIVHGAASGVDTFAGGWARDMGVEEDPHPVTNEEWNRYGNRAGIRRNALMLAATNPDLVMAFAGGRGTTDMACRALRAKVPLCSTWLDDWIERYRAHTARFKSD